MLAGGESVDGLAGRAGEVEGGSEGTVWARRIRGKDSALRRAEGERASTAPEASRGLATRRT